MSRKNHRVVDGKLLQMDKRFSDLKEKQLPAGGTSAG